MAAGLSDVDPSAPIPQGAACEYFATLPSFLHPGLGKRLVEAFVWVGDKANGSPGGYQVELLAADNYSGP